MLKKARMQWSKFREKAGRYIPFLRKRKPKKRKWYIKVLRFFMFFMMYFMIYLLAVDLNLFWLFGKSPRMAQLDNPKQSIASEVYSSDGQFLGKYFNENRSPVKFSELSPTLIRTLIVTEDVRYYNHFGVDFKGTFSAFWSYLHGDKRGASTITQQLVKNLFKTRTNYSTGLFGRIPVLNTIVMKTKEWITALKLELFYSKNEILTMYMNTVDFGSNAFGIKTACKTFFNTSPAKIRIEEAATLVGMLKAPSYYSPIAHPDRCKERRNTVIQQLKKYGDITNEQCDSLKRLPIVLNYSVEENYDGKANYFRLAVAQFLKNWCRENNYDLYGDGLKVYTTIDSRMQEYAEQAVNTHMKRLQARFEEHWGKENPWVNRRYIELPNFIENLAAETPYYKKLKAKFRKNTDSIRYYLNKPHKMKVFAWKNGEKDTTLSFMDSIRYMKRLLHAGFVSVEPQTGYVRAWVGDINFKYFKYDHVYQSKRQPGSTFKLFVYTMALDHGYAPCDFVVDRQVIVTYMENGEKKVWTPHNADWECTGKQLTLKHAFARSINTIAVQLTQEFGWDEVIKYAYRMGIRTKLKSVPSVCLGSADVSLLELLTSYCTVMNNGNYIEPVLVTKIVDKNGNVVYEHKPVQKRVLSYETAYLMQVLLYGGLTEPGGTTQALWEHDLFRYDTDFGGKTGTSSGHSDGWFIGVTPKLVGGVWVGGEHRSIHFRTSELGEGCKTALPIYGLFMEKVLADKRYMKYRARFGKPLVKIDKNYTCHTIMRNDSLAADSLKIVE
ncbi:MAG: transglycosylase domain-containing protein [Bacteroidota bacterium]